ncbi:RlmE family RNA methyltransferase [Alkalicaulis satelles]|uniref:Ribosomal RNA large subunit methyltransferase E n=1 Tax=Alkalicaulis satelles TaxID=2609175 RepID=A0A5M6ZKH2_9PROT|nr:RlmE family RNA methyltransferase [Alkalicaulis satelles]KAA5804830.1 RlmE family RNA methyltransferase [Alkalicaulis satelles]
MSGAGDDEDEPRRRRRSGPVTKGGDARAAKQLRTRVKTARGRKHSSQRWLDRQLNDPYVARARQEGYRSRAAYKLIELDDKFGLIRPGMRVADLGAAPGGWAQVALKRGAGHVAGVDLLEIAPIPGAILLHMDFTEPEAAEALKEALGGPADLVLSDLAPWTTGHKATDHLRIVALVETAALFAMDVLKPGGTFVAKVFQGGASHDVLDALKTRFDKVRHYKPPASRTESAETFLIAQGFKG